MSRRNWADKKILNRLLTNKTNKTYWDNVRELRSRPSLSVFNKAVELINSSSDKEIVIGIDILAQLGFNPRFKQKEAIDIYFKLLKGKPSPKVLISILYAISHNNEFLDDSHVLQLINYKNHRYCNVRLGLVQALSGIENISAINALVELSNDNDPDIRDWATFSLGTQIDNRSEIATKTLWDRMEDECENVRYEAIAGLAKRQDKRIKNILIHELETIDDTGSIILESIEEYNDIEFIELLEKQIKSNQKTHKVNEEWLKTTLKHLITKHNTRYN